MNDDNMYSQPYQLTAAYGNGESTTTYRATAHDAFLEAAAI